MNKEVAFVACDSCRWWKAHDSRPMAEFVEGVAEMADQLNVSVSRPELQALVPILGDCGLFECRDGEQMESSSKLIVTRTGSGEATIVTDATFGCVQWEARG